MKLHTYLARVQWTGNLGTGTSAYREYSRNHEISGAQKTPIPGSSDPVFRGDPSRYNPEELLVGSLSACHMLWYLHTCADHQVIVTDYEDAAEGVMEEDSDGGGQFTQVILKPRVVVKEEGMIAKAIALHEQAHAKCFISRSVNFKVLLRPHVQAEKTFST